MWVGDFDEIVAAADEARAEFAGRTVWHVSSTSLGGGVAEMLRSFLPYARDAGADNRWVVLSERPLFFGITKRIHNKLHGHPGDGGSLGEAERAVYEEILTDSAAQVLELGKPGDVFFLHDPQTAGLIPTIADAGFTTIWRCHVGVDKINEHVAEAINFLMPYVKRADAFVFSRRDYVWEGLPMEKAFLMPPAIDAFSPKNQELEPSVVKAILGKIGLSADNPEINPPFIRSDGSPGEIVSEAEILQVEPLPDDAFLIAQISRWDVLKDHEGLLECFAEYLGDTEAHLALIGPSSGAVADDPEGPAVQSRIFAAWNEMPEDLRRRIHIVNLPMNDFDENGAMVNAIQRRADVVVQKSLVEGFGLTVCEAMWKAKPVVASAIGGINDQIVDGESGMLVEDPTDLEAFADAFRKLINDPGLAERMGEAAQQRVVEQFLAIPRLIGYARLIGSVHDKRAASEPDQQTA
ncbi:MAG: glycosyltransferase [Thermoleophilia bacterium]|nr:glycosyltransferase [Thermoleophilia bacterium]